MRLLAVALLMASFVLPVTIAANHGALQCHFVNAKGQNEGEFGTAILYDNATV